MSKVDKFQAIDIWMISGMLFVFASLVELAAVGWFMQEEAKPSFSRDNSRRFVKLLYKNRLNSSTWKSVVIMTES